MVQLHYKEFWEVWKLRKQLCSFSHSYHNGTPLTSHSTDQPFLFKAVEFPGFLLILNHIEVFRPKLELQGVIPYNRVLLAEQYSSLRVVTRVFSEVHLPPLRIVRGELGLKLAGDLK